VTAGSAYGRMLPPVCAARTLVLVAIIALVACSPSIAIQSPSPTAGSVALPSPSTTASPSSGPTPSPTEPGGGFGPGSGTAANDFNPTVQECNHWDPGATPQWGMEIHNGGAPTRVWWANTEAGAVHFSGNEAWDWEVEISLNLKYLPSQYAPPEDYASATVTWATRAGTAGSDDFQAVTGTAGTDSQILVGGSIIDDQLAEPTEYFFLDLVSSTGAPIGPCRTVEVGIFDDDFVSIDAVPPVPEGSHNAVTEVYVTARFAYPQPEPVDIYLDTVADPSVAHPATREEDFTFAPANTRQLQPGELSVSWVVDIRGDDRPEPNETVVLEACADLPRGLGTTCARTNVTIIDDDSGTSPSPSPRSSPSPPPQGTATLTVKKEVTNDDGGDLEAEDFPLFVDGNLVHTGVPTTVTAGTTHTVTEEVQPGYTDPEFSGDCDTEGTITLDEGEDATCIVRNKNKPPWLKLVKNVINNDGGSAVPNDWTLAAATGAPKNGRNFSTLGGAGVFEKVYANVSYTLSEQSNVVGYSAGNWVCDGGTQFFEELTLALGEYVTCTITNNDDTGGPGSTCIVGWGLNDQGQASRPAAATYVAIAAGGKHSLALRADGSIVGWGSNTFGQASPPAGTGYVAIAAGTNHSLALTEGGSIVGWGDNTYGQATAPAGTGYIAIAAGGNHSLALKTDGSIVGWGRNDYGQRTPPVGAGYRAIAAGGSHSLALKADGSIVGWGRNNFGQRTPPAGTGYIAIAAGGNHSLALKTGGSIVGWGNNTYGQRTPPAGFAYRAIAAGGNHSLALSDDYGIVGWGRNNYGQRIPPAGTTYSAIAAGGNHSLALSWSCYQPDGLIRKGSGSFVGNNIYNDDGANQTRQGANSRGQTITFGISIQNDGSLPDAFWIKATGTATTMYTVTYLFGAIDITTAVLAGTYATGELAPGDTFLITAKVTVQSSATFSSSVTRLVTITSDASPATVDAVKFVGKRS